MGLHGIRASVVGLALAVLLFASSASAATTIGQAPPTTGKSFLCGPGVGLQLSVETGVLYTVPGPGVITRWRSSASGTVALSVWKGSGTVWTVIGEDQQTIAGTLTEFGVRIPVAGGEHIGLRMPNPTPGCLYETGDTGDQIGVAVAAPIGSPVAITPVSGYRFNVAVDVEPDADKDGYGDETQDQCLGNATAGPCPDVVPPETTIGKRPARKSAKRKAKFTFTANEPGARFECKLDKGRFRPCRSPFRRKLGVGRHKFSVRSVDAAGNVDATPAKFSWKILEG